MPYFPRLSTRPFELMSYDKLDASTKDSITLVVTLTRSMRAAAFGPPMAALLDACAGRRVVVGFDPQPKAETSAQEAALNRRRKWERDRRSMAEFREPSEGQLAHHATMREETAAFNAELARLMDPVDGGSRWVNLAYGFPNVVPVVQAGTPGSIVAQVSLANRVARPLAFLCHADSVPELEAARLGISTLADPAGSILLLDARHDRGMTEASVARQAAALKYLRDVLGEAFETIEKVSLAGSFPASSLREMPRTLEIEERAVFGAVSGSWDIAYGDHASIQPRTLRPGGSGWFPHVDLPSDRTWRIELSDRKSDRAGYVECATATQGAAEWADRAECWGTGIIERVADGGLDIDDVKFTTPGPWVGVRANQHMTRQGRLA